MDFTASNYVKRMFAGQYFVNNVYTEFYENTMNILVTDAQSQTNRRRVSSYKVLLSYSAKHAQELQSVENIRRLKN